MQGCAMLIAEEAMSTQEQSIQRYTYGDYVEWPDDERWEIIEGVPYDMSPAPSLSHQAIVTKLVRHIDTYLDGKPCRVFAAPFDVRLPAGEEADDEIETVVQPDLSVICDGSKLDEAGCRGAPDWVVEILSPSTMEKDIREKFDLYQKHGVREYWIVAPLDKTVIVHVLQDDGRFSPGTHHGVGTKVAVAALEGLEIDLGLVFTE